MISFLQPEALSFWDTEKGLARAFFEEKPAARFVHLSTPFLPRLQVLPNPCGAGGPEGHD